MNYLSKEEIINCGIEFAGEVCFSGEYGEPVYTKWSKTICWNNRRMVKNMNSSTVAYFKTLSAESGVPYQVYEELPERCSQE